MPPCLPFSLRCTSAPASEAFVVAAGSSDKVLHLVPGGYHEVMMSPGVAEGLLGEMISWIKGHLSGPVAAGEGAAGSAAEEVGVAKM